MSFSLLDPFEILSVDDYDNDGVSCRPTKFTVGRGPSDNNDKGKKPVDRNICPNLPKKVGTKGSDQRLVRIDEVRLRAHSL